MNMRIFHVRTVRGNKWPIFRDNQPTSQLLACLCLAVLQFFLPYATTELFLTIINFYKYAKELLGQGTGGHNYDRSIGSVSLTDRLRARYKLKWASFAIQE